MFKDLVTNKIYYHIFDRRLTQSSHRYRKTKSDINILEIEANLQTILSKLSATDILILDQVHENTIVDADLIKNFSLEPKADGAVTTKSNLVLSVQTADCVPVLLYCNQNKVIGVAHCGWKSAKANIIDNLVNKMNEKGAAEINAIIGPAIAQESYEVDEKYYLEFTEEQPENTQFFIPSIKQNHYMFDLPSFVEMKLVKRKIRNITKIAENTYTQPEKYPSYRRSCHTSEPFKQSILSTILIRNTAKLYHS